MVRKHQLRLDVDHKAERPGMAKSLVALAATWAAKAGIGYVGELMRTAAVNKAHESAPGTKHFSGPLTLHILKWVITCQAALRTD